MKLEKSVSFKLFYNDENFNYYTCGYKNLCRFSKEISINIEKDPFKQIIRFCDTIPFYYDCRDDKKTYEFILGRRIYSNGCFCDKSLKFIMSMTGKLMYPETIKDTLCVPAWFKGGKNIDNKSNLHRNIPVYIEKLDDYHAWCRPLNDKDIVVNADLNQIWPTKTKKPPIALVELLNKTTEKIY